MKGVKGSSGMTMPACNSDGTHDYLGDHASGTAMAQGHLKTPMTAVPSPPQKAVQASSMKKKPMPKFGG